jgi:DNA-directed RNA polymerase
VTLTSSAADLPVDSARQKSAFPPNFVHALDASHMLLTAVACAREGVAYAAVHDSYWTHAATVGRMHELLRDEFVRLHADDHLALLREDIVRRHPELAAKLPLPPPKGDLDIEDVRRSTFFFH